MFINMFWLYISGKKIDHKFANGQMGVKRIHGITEELSCRVWPQTGKIYENSVFILYTNRGEKLNR